MSTSRSRNCAHLMLASVLLFASMSTHAQALTLQPGAQEYVNGIPFGLKPESTQTLSFGEGLLMFLDVTNAQVSSTGLPFTIALADDGSHSQVSTTSAISSAQLSLNGNTGTGYIQSVTDSNSISFTIPVTPGISGGGQLTISNLSADYGNRQVFGDITGTNLSAPRTHVHLWDATSLTTNISTELKIGDFPNTNYSVTLSGLSFTQTGLETFSQLLKLKSLSQNVLIASAGIGGSLTGNLILTGNPANYTAPIPEPDTWSMMALGLVGLMGVQRYRRGFASSIA